MVEPENKMANPLGKGGFKKGQSGNPGGRPREKPFRALLLEELEKNEYKRLRKIVLSLVRKGEAGDMAALRMIAERVDGSVSDDFSLSDDGGADNCKTSIVVSFVNPKRRHEDDDLTPPGN